MRRTRGRRGQGLTEYVVLVGLVAILLIAALSRFADALRGAFGAATRTITEQVEQPISLAPRIAPGQDPRAALADRTQRDMTGPGGRPP